MDVIATSFAVTGQYFGGVFDLFTRNHNMSTWILA